MNPLVRIAIAVLLVCALPFAGSAFKVETAEVSPNGTLQAGVPVTVNAIVDFPAISGSTFPTEDTFALFSELERPKWTWAVVISGNENPKPEGYGKFFKISGFELEYPKETSVKLRVMLEGTVPQINTTQNLTVIRFQWLDQSSKVRENGEYRIERKVVNPQDVNRSLEQARTALTDLRGKIDAQTARGANTTEAERKYGEAERLLNTATSGDVSAQAGAIERINTLVEEAEASLDRASAQAEIDRATSQLRNVDEMLTFFKSNSDLANDPRVAAITIKRESAQQSLTSATDSMADGNFNQARIRANQSAEKALEAYNDSVELRSHYAGAQGTPGGSNATAGEAQQGSGILPYVVVLVVIALVGLGVVVYQRRNRWDELG
ncbi:MAG TPA: hypothetical protein PK089_04290 [Methanoregulaceae archaeon]|nr:hypothetical protein [Methanoregulaceae archaeon]HQJ88265.1 hypothetical protein [Methanoregulaceae archaeon]